MFWLTLGVALWIALHLIPTLAPALRMAGQQRLGQKAYRGLFALGVVLALVIMVLGWRSASVVMLYSPPTALKHFTALLMLVAFALFVSARAPTNVKRYIRHPQLTSIIVWGVAHLLANGDQRALVLFGGLSLWALAEIILISRRDGPWQRPQPKPLKGDIIMVVIALVVYGLFVGFLHRWLFGVSPLPS